MKAHEYYDWWQVSGTGLGTTFPGETFQQLHRELSKAGARVVIVSRFLGECPNTIDTGLWRCAHVFGPAEPQVRLTADALEAIGARGAAQALREGRGFAPVLPSEGAAPPDPSGALPPGTSIRDMMNRVQAKILAQFPEMAANMPADVRARIPQPQQTDGVESRSEIVKLLDDYAAAHDQELAGDIAKYGDPRQTRGFDREHAALERDRKDRQIHLLRGQAQDVPPLHELLSKLQQEIEQNAPDSLKVQRTRNRLMGEYERYAKYDATEQSADLKNWLEDVRRLREQHPEVFRPRVTRSSELEAKLKAVGDYAVEITDRTRSIRWRRAAGLASARLPPLGLSFCVAVEERNPDPVRVDRALEQLLAWYELFRGRFAELEPQICQYVINFFRNYREADLMDHEREKYEDDDGDISDAKILASLEGGGLELLYHAHEQVERSVHFDVPRDEEHGVEIRFDGDGEIEDWSKP
jgi:hypothetical protein